jgi:predicted dehydrogenase
MTSSGKDKRRILVVGCGSIGKRHIGNLLALKAGEVVAFDVREERRVEVEKRWNIESVTSLEEAFEQKPHAAVIATPPSLHIPVALQAAEHGCHLFIEKPLAAGMQRVGELLERAQRQRLVTLVGCNMRFHPGLMHVKKLIDAGAVGAVLSARAAFGQYLPDWHPREDYRKGYSARRDLGGGIILDAIHEVDYLRWLVGEIQSVACFAGRLSSLEIETEDSASLLLRFASGAIGEIHVDYVQRAYRRNAQIVGEKGTIDWDYPSREVRWYSADDRQWRAVGAPTDWEANEMYLDEMRHFLRCLDGAEAPALDLLNAKRVLEIALAAKAAAENRIVVEL